MPIHKGSDDRYIIDPEKLPNFGTDCFAYQSVNGDTMKATNEITPAESTANTVDLRATP